VRTARDSVAILTDPPPEPGERHVYGPEPLQFGDLRRPPGPGPHPLLIVVHGGAWKATYNLTHAGHMCAALSAEGFATFSVEYRRIGDPGGGWPGSYDDVLAATDYARGLEGMDRGRIAIAGHSAGGHLALLAGADRSLPVLALAPVSDPDGWQNDAVAAFYGGGSRDGSSPLRRLPLGVRQVHIHGTDDESVPFAMSAGFVEAARAAGDDAELVTLDGAGHFEPIDPQSREWPQVVDAVRALLG
jgi:acetyl esterase/lipase